MNDYNPEQDLIEYRNLKQDEKAIQKKLAELKAKLVSNYFNQHQGYISTGYGIVATYNPREVTRFKNEVFKVAHPLLYKEFTETKVEFRFEVN